MKSIKDISCQEYVINKSKFYSYAYPVFNDDDTKKIIEKLRIEYSDATHVCFAYVLDSPKVEKCSDDGEPVGTAGKPLLELIKKKDLHNLLLVVVRYFGGIKLGAGGLIRAYTTAGKLALDSAEMVEYDLLSKYKIYTSYENLSRVCNVAQSVGYKIFTIDYVAPYVVCLCEDECAGMKNIDGVRIEKIGSEYVCRK